MIKVIDLFVAYDLKPTADGRQDPITLYAAADSDNSRNVQKGTVIGIADRDMFSTEGEEEVEKHRLFRVGAPVRGICLDEFDPFFEHAYLIDGAFLPMDYGLSEEETNDGSEEETNDGGNDNEGD